MSHGDDEKCGCGDIAAILEKSLQEALGGKSLGDDGLLIDDKVLVGSHVPYQSNMYDSVQWGLRLGMYSIQVYMGSQQSYARSKVSDADIEKTRALLAKFPTKLFTHSPVIYNLAGSVKNKSLAWCGNTQVDSMMEGILKSLDYELLILTRIGAIGTVIHPGCYILEKGKTQAQSEAEAITAIATTIQRATTTPGGAKIILENCAGEKGKVAYDLQQLVKIREQCGKNKDNVAFCLDTAHSFGSGLYNLSTVEGVTKMFTEIDQVRKEGKGEVALIHLNDSEVPFGSKKDRHALLRTGYIWKDDDTALKYLLMCAGERGIPLILETSPSDMYTLAQILR